MRKILFMILIMMATAARMSAQDDPQYRMEVGAGAGLVTYEGDSMAIYLPRCNPWEQSWGAII